MASVTLDEFIAHNPDELIGRCRANVKTGYFNDHSVDGSLPRDERYVEGAVDAAAINLTEGRR